MLLPSLFSKAGSMFHPAQLSVVDYNSLSMFFSFVGGITICPRAMLDYVPGGGVGWRWWQGVWCMDHLLGLHIYADRFEIGWWGEIVGGFSQGRCLLGLGSTWQGTGRLSMG
jgi:hypothetical protein